MPLERTVAAGVILAGDAARLIDPFFLNDTATTEISTGWYTLSLHDALPICRFEFTTFSAILMMWNGRQDVSTGASALDRKSTRLNSSHTIQSRMPSSA